MGFNLLYIEQAETQAFLANKKRNLGWIGVVEHYPPGITANIFIRMAVTPYFKRPSRSGLLMLTFPHGRRG